MSNEGSLDWTFLEEKASCTDFKKTITENGNTYKIKTIKDGADIEYLMIYWNNINRPYI